MDLTTMALKTYVIEVSFQQPQIYSDFKDITDQKFTFSYKCLIFLRVY